MSRIIEEEIKLKLDADTYHRLRVYTSQECGAGISLDQENVFFDSADERLRQCFMSVRIRRQNNSVFLTVKQRQASDQLIHRQDEHEIQLNSAVWPSVISEHAHLDRLLPIPQHCLDVLAGEPLIPFMRFSNQRWQFHDGPHEICLDHSLFNNSINEYELEIESSAIQDAAEKWLPLLKKWGYTETIQSQSKLERCFNYTRNIKTA